MKSTVVLLLCVVGVAVAMSVGDVEWETFKSSYGRQYENPTEEALRKKIFHDNKVLIDQQNQLYAQGKSTFTMGINQFADMTNQEFRAKMSRRVVEIRRPSNVVELPPSINAGATGVDWRDSGCVRGVDNQGECTGSLAMSAAESIEFCQCTKYGDQVFLSQQSIIDCCSAYGNSMTSLFRCAIGMGGVASSSSYPSTTCSPSLCHIGEASIAATIVTYVDIATGSESQLQSAVDNSIVATAVDSSRSSFQLYAGGVYDDPLCSSTALDHSVVVVGYGTEFSGVEYWLVENSWSRSWGEDGYIRMARNKNNQCGIATDAAYPIC